MHVHGPLELYQGEQMSTTAHFGSRPGRPRLVMGEYMLGHRACCRPTGGGSVSYCGLMPTTIESGPASGST